jgi:16S rRNA (cytosine967-C5)-methyltransferase
VTDAVKPGLAARRAAARLVTDVLARRGTLDQLAAEIGADAGPRPLPAEDAALARAIATVSLRRWGGIEAAVARRLESGWPEPGGSFKVVMVTAVAQLLFMNTPDHAVVDCAVALVQWDRHAKRYAALANAVLRRIARERDAILLALADEPLSDLPGWLGERWRRRFGDAEAAAAALALRERASVDLTPNAARPAPADPSIAAPLPGGSLRLLDERPIETLPGYADGAFWVQDVAASLPVRLFGPLDGRSAIDLCAAPGGKTAQLAAGGADVVAIDRSEARLETLDANLRRLGLRATVLVGDATAYEGAPADLVLLDAPCSATGTLRRHPDVAHVRTLEDVGKLVGLQRKLLDRAVALMKPGGILVYVVCSLEAEEGLRQAEGALMRHAGLRRMPVSPEEAPGFSRSLTEAGDLMILPHHFDPAPAPVAAGSDGFFIARFRREP